MSVRITAEILCDGRVVFGRCGNSEELVTYSTVNKSDIAYQRSKMKKDGWTRPTTVDGRDDLCPDCSRAAKEKESAKGGHS